MHPEPKLLVPNGGAGVRQNPCLGLELGKSKLHVSILHGKVLGLQNTHVKPQHNV